MSSPPYRLSVLTNSISRMNSGISDAMRNLTLAIAAEGRYLPVVFSAQDTYTESDQPLWRGATTTIFSVRGPRMLGYAPGLTAALESSAADILHIHGIWMYPSVAASRWSQGRRPYVVSPHGLLKPRAMRNSRWKKRIAALLYEDKHLRGAACLHALNVAEADALRRYGLKNPICVIPNGTDLRGDTTPNEPRSGHAILYLGRFHPLKGLRNLIEAWGLVRGEAASVGWRLTLAGWDQNRHRAELEQIVDQLEVRSSVEFPWPAIRSRKGPLSGSGLCVYLAQPKRRLASKHSRSVVVEAAGVDDPRVQYSRGRGGRRGNRDGARGKEHCSSLAAVVLHVGRRAQGDGPRRTMPC